MALSTHALLFLGVVLGEVAVEHDDGLTVIYSRYAKGIEYSAVLMG